MENSYLRRSLLLEMTLQRPKSPVMHQMRPRFKENATATLETSIRPTRRLLKPLPKESVTYQNLRANQVGQDPKLYCAITFHTLSRDSETFPPTPVQVPRNRLRHLYPPQSQRFLLPLPHQQKAAVIHQWKSDQPVGGEPRGTSEGAQMDLSSALTSHRQMKKARTTNLPVRCWGNPVALIPSH